MDKIQKIREVIEKRYEYWKEKESNSHSIESEIRMSECQHLLLMLNSLQEEPVSEDLEEAAIRYAKEEYNHKNPATLPDRCIGCYAPLMYMFKAGAKWQEQKMMANAIDADVVVDRIGEVTYLCPHTKATPYKKVKVIVIKED